jgi:D-apionolactonase
LKSTIQFDSFHIEFDCVHQRGEIDFRWHGTIVGTATGEISCEMAGEAHSDFLCNRLGFCVLHPIDECAGQPCEVLHTDGTIEQSLFPRDIAPHQPFLDVRALTHGVLPGVRATVRMEGEIFETEDQRNWTDWSFKTYGTPLSLPFPVLVKKGERIGQRVTLRLSGLPPTSASLTSGQPTVTRVRVGAEPIQTLPHIGLGMASHGQPLTQREVRRLRALKLSHLRVDLNLPEAGFKQRLAQAVAEAEAVGVELEVALFFSDAVELELQQLRSALQRLEPRVLRWLVFHRNDKVPNAQLVQRAKEALRQYDARALIVTGTDAWFTEINRQRPPVEEAEGLCYAISPQTHAIDDLTLMENLVGQAATVQNAKRMFGPLPIAVTPITLKPRFSPSAIGAQMSAALHALPPQVDPRQPSLQAAAWTLGSLKYLAESGTTSLTYFETTGWCGVMEGAAGSIPPYQFNSLPGAVFPVWHLLADLGEFTASQVIPLYVQPTESVLKVTGLALCRGGQMQVVLANLTAKEQQAQVELSANSTRLRRLNQDNLLTAIQAPELFRTTPMDIVVAKDRQLSLTLAPYELITLLLDTTSGT